jgi:sorbitol/mannitol transport system permease protein
MSISRRRIFNGLLSAFTWLLGLAMFFPILWMALTSFKTEQMAFSWPPLVVFRPTLANWINALLTSPYLKHFQNTLVVTASATLLAIALGVPAAYKLAFHPTRRSDFTLLWVMSTRMMPAVGVIIPLYIIYRDLGLFDTYAALTILYAGMNLPLVIWMMRSFFLDLPFEIVESARMDGVNLAQELRHIILPLTWPGLAASILLCMIFAWNEFFFAFNLTIVQAAPLSVYVSQFKTSEGLYWASMSAAATATVLPVVIAGWFTQRQLVTGLTMGALRE